MMKTLLVVFTDPVPGAEDEYNRWYTEEHLPDCLAVPGYIRATRYRAFEGVDRAITQEYLSLYELEVPDVEGLQKVSVEHMRRIETGEMRAPPPDTIDRETMRALYYTANRPRLGRKDTTPESVFLPFTDPVSEERSGEYNQWYDDTHLPEVCSVQGFDAATRYKITDVNMLGKEWVTELSHLAVYELLTSTREEFEATTARLQQPLSLTGERMYISPALDMTRLPRWAGYRVSPRVYHSDSL